MRLDQISRLSLPASMALFLALGFTVMYAVVHRCAGLTFPVPMNDESWILWKSLAWAEHGTLETSQLNGDRILFTFPGYEVLLGVFVKYFGLWYPEIRVTSLVFICISFWAVIAMLPGEGWARPFMTAVAGWCFLGPSFIIAGNMVRPEAFVVMLFTVAHGLALQKRAWSALAVASLSIIAHLNGLYMMPFLAAAVTLHSSRWWRNIDRGQLLVLIVVGLIWACFAVFYIAHLAEFTEQLRFGVAVKHQDNTLQHIVSSRYFWQAVAGVLFMIGGLRWGLRTTCYGSLAAGCHTICLLGHLEWYRAYESVGLLMIALSVCEAIAFEFSRLIANRQRLPAPAVLGVAVRGLAVMPILWYSLQRDVVSGPRNFLADLSWGGGMRLADEAVPYWDGGDIVPVLTKIRSILGPGRLTRVSFASDGDGLLWAPLLQDECTIYHPVFTRIQPEVIVLRESRYHPPWWTEFYFASRRSLFGLTEEDVVWNRNQTERWYVKDVRAIAEAQAGRIEWPLEVFWYRYRDLFATGQETDPGEP